MAKKTIVGTIPKSYARRAAESKEKRKSVEKTLGRSLPDWLLELPELKRNDVIVLLLNAHGGIDPKTGEYVTQGKRSPKWDDEKPVHGKNIIFEGQSSREFNNDLKFYCIVLGIPVKIINDTCIDTPIASKRFNALKFARDEAKGPCFALELHSNATKGMLGKASGFEFFTLPGKSLSDPMADIYGQKMDKELPECKHRRFSPGVEKEARFGILKMDPLYVKLGKIPTITRGIPIVLSENGFMDNEKNCKELLIDPKGRERIVKFHVEGFVEIINELY